MPREYTTTLLFGVFAERLNRRLPRSFNLHCDVVAEYCAHHLRACGEQDTVFSSAVLEVGRCGGHG